MEVPWWRYKGCAILDVDAIGGNLDLAVDDSSCENSAKIVGRTPWSARVPLDPLFATGINLMQTGAGQGAVCGPGVRPTIFCRPCGHGKNERAHQHLEPMSVGIKCPICSRTQAAVSPFAMS